MRLALLVSCALTLIACGSTGIGTNDDLGNDLASSPRDDLSEPQSCSQWTDDDSCSAHGCVPQDCPGCGVPTFAGCYAVGVTPAECSAPPCVSPPACTGLTTQAACNANPQCTVIFQQALCNCDSPDCCPMIFNSCAITGSFECVPPTGGPGSCPLVLSCDSGYLAAYGSAGCEIGCVETAVCTG
jgi:hypothetical protein